MNKVLKFIDHYRNTVLSVVVALALVGVLLFNGCGPIRVTSPKTGEVVDEVTYLQHVLDLRAESEAKLAEAERFVALVESKVDISEAERQAAYARRDAIREAIERQAVTVGGMVPAPWGGILLGGLGLLSVLTNVGLGRDTLRKDREIAARGPRTPAPAPAPTTT